MDYRKERYLEFLPVKFLLERMRDFFGNLATHAADGRLAPLGVIEYESLWVSFTHILEEFDLRGASWRNPIINFKEHLAVPRSERVMKSLRLIKDRQFVRSGSLYRFGKHKHMRSLLEFGTVRIAPASSFQDAGIGAARRDTELWIETMPRLRDLNALCARDHLLPPEVGPLPEYSRPWKYIAVAKSDYYIYCLSNRYDHRFFDDFDADAVVVIKDPGEFARRLHLGVELKLKSWKSTAIDVEYVDPLFPRTDTLNPFFCKHFKYYYQQEHRHFWISLNNKTVSRLTAFLVDIGPLDDICELATLS